MTIIDAPQRSPEWFAARLGRVTSSRCSAVFAKGRGGAESKEREALRLELSLERITGQSAESGYSNADMQRGVELEPEAIRAYEAYQGVLVSTVGFVAHDSMMVGTSPDAVGMDGDRIQSVVEVKCPRQTTHWGYVQDPATLVAQYAAQIRHHLWVTNASWCDVVSYCPSFPDPLKLVVVIVDRRNEELDAHALAVSLFLGEVDVVEASIRQRIGRAA